MKQGTALPAVAGTTCRPRRRRARLAAGLCLAALGLAALAAALAGCGEDNAAGSGGGKTELRVFAASSLTAAFTTLGERYTAAHPDVTVAFNFAGSQDLVAQLQQGAPADVLATADQKNIDAVTSLVEASQVFAANQLEIVVAPGNPLDIKGLAGLGRDDLKVVLAAPEVPAGKYAARVLQEAGVTAKPVSLEDSVKGVITKVSLGEADAGVVYVTDVKAAGDSVAGIELPADQNVTATYPVARVRASAQAQAAQDFIDLVLSPEGQQVLRDTGFLPAQQ